MPDKITKEHLHNMAEALQKLPRPKYENIDDWLNTTGQIICSCPKKKAFPVSQVQIIDTGYLKVIDRTCPNCEKDMPKDWARVICIGCKEVVARIKPGTNNRGFKIEPYKSYHIEDCPRCNPDKYNNKVVESRLIEEIVWSKRNPKIQILT